MDTLTHDETTAAPIGTPVGDAVAVIDAALAEILNRELVSTAEVADLLLDVRSILATAEVEAEAEIDAPAVV